MKTRRKYKLIFLFIMGLVCSSVEAQKYVIDAEMITPNRVYCNGEDSTEIAKDSIKIKIRRIENVDHIFWECGWNGGQENYNPEGYPVANLHQVDSVLSFPLANLEIDEDSIKGEYTWFLKMYPRSPREDEEPIVKLEYIVTIYKKPHIIDGQFCGYEKVLEVDRRWGEFETYEWKLTEESDNGKIIEDKETKVYKLCIDEDLHLKHNMHVNLTVTTNDKTCVSRDEATITLKGYPQGTLTLSEVVKDKNGSIEKEWKVAEKILVNNSDPMSAYVCSTNEGKDFQIELNNINNSGKGVEFKSGESAYGEYNSEEGYLFSRKESGILKIEVKDKGTGCVVSTDIKFIDDKPALSIAPEEPIFLESQETKIFVPAQSANVENDTVTIARYLDLSESYSDFNVSFGEYIGDKGFDVESNMTGIIGLTYNETHTITHAYKLGEEEQCKSDDVNFLIDVTIPVRNPDGFSPNEDGVNDRLVFEGLPENNHLSVFDSRGVMVYEKENYRNDWKAEGLDDGYYLYVLEGQGIKTLKESLVIKRK